VRTEGHAAVSKREKRKPSSPWVVAAVLFIAVGAAFILRQAEVVAVQRRLGAMQEEIQYYGSLNDSLAKQIEVLKSDDYVEKTAREKLGLVMPGEIQYMLVASKSKD
jgi:cell division protein FtsB